ncbi:MAG TPA: formate dehydrogenase subunit alpha [Syntrophaceae bacterium]|nr:formate dehydrogenase subunit alpha [Syntrophaceae bacterium]
MSTRKIRTTCSYCGCGCQINLEVSDTKLIRVIPHKGFGLNSLNKGSICIKGTLGHHFIRHKDRLRKPLIKKGKGFQEVNWDEALDLVADSLSRIRAAYGADSIAGLGSAKCTNEENYVMQKFMRAVIGTNNIDHCARHCHASSIAALAAAFGSAAMTNSISDIEKADVILLIGSNTTENHPVIGIKIRNAVARKGKKLIVVDPREIDLAKYADMWLRPVPGTDVAWLNGMMHVIIAEDLWNKGYVETRTENFLALKETVKKYNPELVEKITGILPQDLIKAAHLYARAERASIIYAMGMTQYVKGTDNVKAVANLAMLCGNVGIEGGGVNPLRGQNNVQGACDMGSLPDLLPGYQSLSDAATIHKFEETWGVPLPTAPGLTATEILTASKEGRIKALYIMGENPLISFPDSSYMREALKRLEFLVVQDIFLTETGKLAAIVLPSASFAEKDGTFTNTERRIQRVRQAFVPYEDAKLDWEIITLVSERMGYKMGYQSPEDIMQEIASLTPIYGGIYYARLEKQGIQWPCPDENHPGTPFLHKDGFDRGLGLFHPVEFAPPTELPDEDYPFILSTGRVRYHYNTGTLSRRCSNLNRRYPEPFVEINPIDATVLGIDNGTFVRVSSRRGSVIAKVRITERIPAGVLFIPFHFREAAANLLTLIALDPIAKIPEYKFCAVNVKPLKGIGSKKD